MLKDILAAEASKRAAQAGLQESVEAERAAIVAGLHAVFRAQLPDLEGVMLVGDYGHPVALTDRQKAYSSFGHSAESGAARCMRPTGVVIELGPKISPRRLTLTVSARVPGTGREAYVLLQHQRDYPYTSDSPREFPGHTPAEDMVRALLELLAHEIHMEATCSSVTTKS